MAKIKLCYCDLCNDYVDYGSEKNRLNNGIQLVITCKRCDFIICIFKELDD